MGGLSLVAASRGDPLAGASLCGAQAFHCSSFSCCGTWVVGAWASVVKILGLIYTGACGIFQVQGSNLCPLH